MPERYAENWWLVRVLGQQRYLLATLLSLLILLPLLHTTEVARISMSGLGGQDDQPAGSPLRRARRISARCCRPPAAARPMPSRVSPD